MAETSWSGLDIVSEYDQEMPQSQTTDQPTASCDEDVNNDNRSTTFRKPQK